MSDLKKLSLDVSKRTLNDLKAEYDVCPVNYMYTDRSRRYMYNYYLSHLHRLEFLQLISIETWWAQRETSMGVIC